MMDPRGCDSMWESSAGPGCCRMLCSQVTISVSNRGCQLGNTDLRRPCEVLHLNSRGMAVSRNDKGISKMFWGEVNLVARVSLVHSIEMEMFCGFVQNVRGFCTVRDHPSLDVSENVSHANPK